MNHKRQVRCSSCGQWTFAEPGVSVCTHCGTELFPLSKADAESLERRKQAWKILTPVDSTKPWPVRWLKHTSNAIQMVFLAIISFIMWLIAISPG